VNTCIPSNRTSLILLIDQSYLRVFFLVFFTLSLKASYDFDIYKQVKVQFNAGIQNIGNVYQRDLDKGWNRDASYIYGPSLPRCFYVGLKLMY